MLLLYVAVPVFLQCLTMGHKDISESTMLFTHFMSLAGEGFMTSLITLLEDDLVLNRQPARPTSNVIGNTESHVLEGSGNFNNDFQQKSEIPGYVKDVCVRGCLENENGAEDGGSWGLTGGLNKRFHAGPALKFQDRIIISSQQATELLVSSWNDLSNWSSHNDTSSVCEQDVERTMKNFLSNELWALRMFDSWAKPGPSLLDGRSNFVGNYYQCRHAVDDMAVKKVGFGGNYCVIVMANLTNQKNENPNIYLNSALAYVQLGVCLPDTCLQEDIRKLFQERIQALNLTHLLKAVSTDCRTEEREYTTFTVIALFFVLVIGTLTLLGTIVDITIIQFPYWMNFFNSEKEIKDSSDKSPQIMKDVKASQDRTAYGMWVKILLSFSAYTNGQKLLSTSQGAGSINVIPGLRFLTMSWIVVGHTFFLLVIGHSSNIYEGIHSVTQYRFIDLIISMHFGVDTFFTISGFLVSYLTIKKVIEKGLGFGWKHFFLHRYWRLTPTFMVCFILIQGLQRFMVSGSVAPTLQPNEKLGCEKKWWYLPLYLHNLFNVELEDGCFGQAWSLAADFQFYLLSPFMMIPFYYHKAAGVMSCLLFIVGQWIVAGILCYKSNGPISMIELSLDWFKYCYCPFYSRVAPFVVGILSGYILSNNNGRVKMSSTAVIIGWMVASIGAIVVIFGFHGDISGESPSSLLVSTIYNAVSRTVWGAAVCWVLVACSSGYGGPVTTFLSWSPFTVLGRLTYIGYLVQVSVSTIIFENLEQLTILNLSSLFVFGLVNVFFTCLVSAVLVLCVEFPTLNLERVLRERK